MSPGDLPALNIADLQALLRKREISPREVLESLRKRIEDVDPEIDAYLSRERVSLMAWGLRICVSVVLFRP